MIERRYPIEFVQSLIQGFIKALGFTEPEVIADIADEVEIDAATGTELRSIVINTDYIDFELHEVVIMQLREGCDLAGPDKTIGYQPWWFRGIPARAMNPPDVDEHSGDCYANPTDAIREGIIACVKERIDNQCSDQMMYQDWLEEQGKTNGG